MKMSSRLFSVVNRVGFSSLQLALKGPLFCQTCSIYDESYLKIVHFKKEREFFSKKFGKTKKNNFSDETRSKIISSLEQNVLKFNHSNLNDMVFLAKQAELELVISATKFLLSNGSMQESQAKGFGVNLMRLIYVMNDPELGLKIVNDKELEPLFGNHGYAYFILMNKLVEQKKYNLVVELFEQQLPFFQEVKLKKTSNNIISPLPYDQVCLVVESLLYMNSKESFEKLKTMIDIFQQKKFQLNNLIMARSFLLSIKQNDPEFAFKLLTKFQMSNLDVSLARNLAIISLSEMNLIDDALKLAENLRGMAANLDFSDKTKFIGKFLPITLKSLERIVDRSQKIEHKTQFEELLSDIKAQNNRVYWQDLEEYCKQS